jgi:FkbM family methyltransferase
MFCGFDFSARVRNKQNMLNHLAPTVRKRMARLTRYRRKLAASIRKRTARLLWPDGHGVVRRDGALFLLDLNNWYDKVILKWGPGEPEQRLYLLDNIRQRECETFLDVGANFGTYAAFVALCTKATTIIAYEPDRRSYDRLRTHLLLNRVHKKVETRMAAVSNRNGMVPFIRAPDDNDSLSKVGEDGSDNYSVHAVRLDDELPLTGHRIALKVDVEGHELSALEGMKSLLRANDCFLQVECWKENAACFIDAMKAEGYGLLHQIEQDHYFAKEG